MRFLFRLLLGLVAFVAFLGLLGSGALWAYGEYGIAVLDTQMDAMEDQIEEDFEDQYPGSTVTVDFEEVYYKLAGTSLVVAFKVHVVVKVASVTVDEQTMYIALDVAAAVQGSGQPETYDEGAQWDAVKQDFSAAPEEIFSKEKAQNSAISYAIICAAAFVGALVIKGVFFKKK